MDLLAQAASGGNSNTAEVILFVVFAVIALGAGIAMVTMRNIVHSALMLVINFLAIAGLYLGLQSAFLSIVQVIVYAGAIMVLFLFVIMLLGVDRDDLLVESNKRHLAGAVLGAGLLAAALLFGFVGTYTSADSRCGDQAPADVLRSEDTQPCVGLDEANAASDSGSVGVVADRLFTRYTFPFEVAAVLLTVATIGAMLLGRRHDRADDPAFQPSADVPDDIDVEVAMAALESQRRAAAGAPLVSDDPDVVAADRARILDDVADDATADADPSTDTDGEDA